MLCNLIQPFDFGGSTCNIQNRKRRRSQVRRGQFVIFPTKLSPPPSSLSSGCLPSPPLSSSPSPSLVAPNFSSLLPAKRSLSAIVDIRWPSLLSVVALLSERHPLHSPLVARRYLRCIHRQRSTPDTARAHWKMVDDDYRSLEFPFEPVEGTEHTGPFEFEAKHSMDLDAYLTYIRSWSTYQTARQEGFKLLREEVVEDFKHA